MWTRLTAHDPSPTAEATRFIDDSRTSPTAKINQATIVYNTPSGSANLSISLSLQITDDRGSQVTAIAAQDAPLGFQLRKRIDQRR